MMSFIQKIGCAKKLPILFWVLAGLAGSVSNHMKNAKSEIPENVDCVSLIPFDLIRWKLHTYICM